MVKPTNGTGSVRENQNFKTSDKTSDEASEVLQDFSDIKVEYLEIPVKSENDKKEYRVIKLPNGLKALLIADHSPVSCSEGGEQEEDGEDDEDRRDGADDEEESGSKEDGEDEVDDKDEDEDEKEGDETDNDEGDGSAVKKIKREEKKAACGLCVGVGAFSDPWEIQGMAHFLEHMVFMGSKKYPQENDFFEFTQKHGGDGNAYTDCEQTFFHFDIQEKFLHSALDRFAQFFISPLMKHDAITRERETVESGKEIFAPPRKKLKVSHKYSEMVKPINGTGSVRENHNLKTSDKTSDEASEVLQDFSDVKVEYLEIPVKSENDKKEYRVIKLPNGLKALLIADPSPVSCSEGGEQEEDEEDDKDRSDGADDEKGSGSKEDGEEEVDVEEDKDENEDEKEGDETDNGEGAGSAVKKMKREEKMAACGLCVGVGAFSDPWEIQGMAHFLEHMVFMGSKKYPQENDFFMFTQKHGGDGNAYTECEQTFFHFDVQEKFLHSALDRFAQFFISPLMKRDAITREREVVESEFQMALPCDFQRKKQVFKTLAQTGHPFRKLDCGNRNTLCDNVTDDKLYEELHKFRERHYSAHRMTVAIQARLPLDTLEKYVKECFYNVPNNNLPADDFTKFKGPAAFDTSRFCRIYKIKPVKDVCQIVLTWTMQSLFHLYRSKPHQYVSKIISHEGKGSLISYLRKKLWCLDIYSGNGETGFEHSSMYTLFDLCLVLTDEGHKHLKEVLDAVFSYLNLVRREGPQKRIYDEIHKIKETQFRFCEEMSPIEYVKDLSKNMHFYAPKDYINGRDLYFEYDPVSIKACMDVLTPENANIIIHDKKFNEEEFEKIEPWFETKYTDTEVPEDWIAHWKKIEPMPDFHLPEPNIFVTDDFTLIPTPEVPPEYPVKIHSDALSEVWYKPDTKFGLPECYMNFYYISPLPLAAPENAAMLDLFVTVMKQLLREELYPAAATNLYFDIYASDRGLEVKVNGYNQKLPILLTTVTKYIADFPNLVTEDLFDVMKEDLMKDYYNMFLGPYELDNVVGLSLITLVHWSSLDKHAAISGIEFQQFKNFAKYFSSHIYIKCLVQGNMTSDRVTENAKKCVEILNCGPLLPNTMPQLRVAQIPLGERCCRVKNFNPTDSNSVVTNYYQSGGTSIKLAALIELMIMIMKDPLFNQLRTKEQLGYHVFCLMRDTFGVLGYSVTCNMQAHKYSTEHGDERIEAFLTSFKKTLNEMSDKELSSFKEALIKVKQCTDIYLNEEVEKHWAEITSSQYVFDRAAREVEAIRSIKIEDLRKWIANHTKGGCNFRKLSVQVVGSDGKEEACKDETKKEDNEVSKSNKKRNNAVVEYGAKVEYPLIFLNDLPNEKKKKTNDYYINNIEDYKQSLYIFPLYKSTSTRKLV